MAAAVVRNAGSLLLSLVLDTAKPAESLVSGSLLLKYSAKLRQTRCGFDSGLAKLLRMLKLSLDGAAAAEYDVSCIDKLEATWLQTSESFSELASTSRSIIGFIMC